jgi:pyrimidine deaminase RibD-like protein
MKSKNNKKYYKNYQNQSYSERFLKSKNPTVGAIISCYFKENGFQKLL